MYLVPLSPPKSQESRADLKTRAGAVISPNLNSAHKGAREQREEGWKSSKKMPALPVGQKPLARQRIQLETVELAR